jgi:hypothetical protein
MRTFEVSIAGQKYEIPTEFGILAEAERYSGVIAVEAIATQRYGLLLQGVIYAGLKKQGVKEIAIAEGAEIVQTPLSYEAVGRASSFYEASGNLIEFMRAMAPDTTTAEASDPNAQEGTPEN